MDQSNTSEQSSVDVKETNKDAKNVCTEGSKEMDGSTKKSSVMDQKVKSPVPAQKSGYLKSILLRISRIWPLKYMFKMLKKIAVFAGLSEEVENVGSADPLTPNKRRFLSGKKRIGRLARLILLVTPYRIQCALGYRTGENIGKTSADDIRKSPLKPCGKGSKRKQDDLDIEEQHSWVTFMAEDFPEEDQEDDPTYEPSNTESDTEENKSDNDTESDLEVEEKDGIVMLKETTQEETQGNEKQQNMSESKESSKDGEDSELKNPAPTD